MIDKLFFMFKALRREVYRKDLRTAYKDWLEERSIENDTTLMDMMNNLSEEEYFEAIDKAKINDDALINKLFKESFRGLTEEEVESYKRSSDLFREFMETEGFNYKYNKNGKPKYVTYKSKNYKDASGNLDLSNTLKRASNEELDNAIIDFIYDTLTSYEGSLLMMRQGTYRDVKKSSRIERILHNRRALESFIEKYGADNIQEKLNKLSTKELDNIYEEDATPRSPMDIMYWADNHRNLMDGNDLIGMLAVSSSSHYKLQFLNLKLKEDYIIRLNGKELYELDRVYSPITKKRIGELCAQLQAASPDNGKDPCLGDMNINPKTVDLACLLVRLGVDLTDVGMILNSQEVLNFAYESDESQEKPKIDKEWNLDTAKLAEIKAYITLGKYDLVDPSFIVNFKEWFKNLEKVAKDMTAMNPVLRSDSPNGALKSDFAEAIRQILILKDLKENVLKDGNFSIKGFNELIDFDINATDMSRDELFDKFIKNKIPRLQAIFSLGFTSAVPVIQERLSDFSEASIERLALFMEQTGMDLKKSRNTTIIKQLLNEYNAFLLTKDKIFSGEEESSLLEKRNYYIHDFPIKFNAILTVKDNEGFYKYNNIKNLPAIKRISNKTDKGIKMDNIGKISPETRKWYTESFDQLLNMGNDVSAEEKKVAQDLAVDLLLYAFFDNGLTFRYNSFSNFFSSLYMTSIPGLVDAYRMAENLTRSTNNYDERFMAQFLINHPKYVAKVSSKTIKREGNLIYPIKSEGFYPDGIYTPDKKRYREFIALGRGNDITIFRRVIDLSGDDKLAYEKVEINNTGTLYYDGNTNSSDIDYTKVKARGNVKVKLDRLLKEKIIKEKTTMATKSTNKWKWGVTSNNGFEVSTAANIPSVLGDSRFSALNAKFKSGTIIDGVNVGGKTIEYVYQTVIKKSGKGIAPSKGSRLNLNPTSTSEEKRLKFLKEVKAEYGNPLTYSTDEGVITVNFENGSLRVLPFAGSIEDLSGKFLGNKDINYFIGALKATEDLAGGYENFSYTEGYLPLWQEWAEQNPELIEELREKARGRELTDRFASKTTVSQARALADILNSTEKEDDSSLKPTIVDGKPLVFNMNYSYGNEKADWVTADTTLEAIKLGERTATTRYVKHGNIERWKKVKVGDIVKFKDKDNNSVLVRITKPLAKLPKNVNVEEWSAKEGWNTDRFYRNVKPEVDKGEAYQIEFELATNNQSLYSDEPLVRDNFNDNDEFLPNDSGSNDSPIDLNDFKSDDDDVNDKVVAAASSDDNIVIPSNVSFSDDNISIAGITAAANSSTDWLFVAKGKNVSSEEANRFIEGAANSANDNFDNFPTEDNNLC